MISIYTSAIASLVFGVTGFAFGYGWGRRNL